MSANAAPTPQQGTRSIPKVLRIGVVQEGKIATERLIRIGETVTVGESPKNTFVITGTKLGQRLELFVAKADGTYLLSAPDWIEGKLSWKDGIRGLDELRTRGEAVKKGDQFQVQLNENVRGKVSIGTSTLLFQFVPAPPEPMKQMNASDFRPRLFDEEDPLFHGLLAIFTVIACSFMLWVYTSPLPERLDLDAVADAVDLVVEDKIKQIVIEQEQEVEAEVKKEEKPAVKEAKQEQTKTDTPEPVTKESVTKKSMLLQFIGTTGNADGDAVADMLGDDGASMAGLDAALSGVTGAQEATAGNIGVKGGTGKGSENAKVGVGVNTGGTASTGSGTETKIRKPKVDLGTVDADVESGDAGGIASVVKKSSGRIQTCVEQGLKVNENLNGRVSVGWTISGGKVTEAHLVSNNTGDDGLGKCIVTAVRGFRFSEDTTANVAEFPWVVSGQ